MYESPLKSRLSSAIKPYRNTLLGIGPMSKNCVDATIELAEEHKTDLMLIASRRQIECADFGSGYVENWSTEDFADYVTRHDRANRVLLCRDHGGPWQGFGEKYHSYKEAMARAKHSYAVDIASGFSVIHIDPSVSPTGAPDVETVLERIYELYEFCWYTAQKLNKDIVFEVGTEEQGSGTGTPEELEYVLSKITDFCHKNRLPMPVFVVAQTGTKVMETQNIGVFGERYNADTKNIDLSSKDDKVVRDILKKLDKYDVWLKQHNTDYLDNDTLKYVPKFGVHAANVAPEYGVDETRALVKVLKENGLKKLHDDFIALAFNSNKWDKWMLPKTKASDYDKAIISGHYVFAKPECRELKEAAKHELSKKGVDLEVVLKNAAKSSILRYLTHFNLIK